MSKIILAIILSCTFTFALTCYCFLSASPVIIQEPILFQSEDGEFNYKTIPEKGRNYKLMEQAFRKHKVNFNSPEEMKVFRVTRKNYFKLAMWCSYKNQAEWQYPTKGWF